jgi:hypothetical protein
MFSSLSTFWTRSTIPINGQLIACLADPYLKSQLKHILAQATKDVQVWEYLDKIEQYLTTTKPWSDLTEVKFVVFREELWSYIYSMMYPYWRERNHKLQDDDLSFHDRVVTLVSVMKQNFMGIEIPPSKDQLLDEAIDQIRELDQHVGELPTRMLCRLHDACNTLSVILKDEQVSVPAGVDGFISCLIWVVIKAKPQHLISISQWIEECQSPYESQSGELNYIFTHMLVAIQYILTLEPNSKVVRVELQDIILARNEVPTDLPVSYQDLYPLLKPILAKTRRFKGAGIGATISSVVLSPVTLALSFFMGFGIPMMIGIIATGTALGSTIGALVTPNHNKHIEQLVSDANKVLKEKGMTLIDPLLTNRTNPEVTDIKYVEFLLVTSLPQGDTQCLAHPLHDPTIGDS